ncbi:MAG: phosphoribosylanthranilate isomerase [Gemmatimonadales bacterium]
MTVEAKICGLTRPRDAALAAELGAWRLGVIFAGGPRIIAASVAAEIVRAAGDVPVLGVFGSQSLETILAMLDHAGLSGAQLHGSSDDATAAAIRARGFEVWRVIALDDGVELGPALAAHSSSADALLVEARTVDRQGGKGIALPLDVARKARLAAPAIPFVLAGGLTDETVTAAIRAVDPDAVDVSSGVEQSMGIKDHARLARFLENVFAARSAA